MKLRIDGLRDGGWIDERFALGVHDPDDHVRFSANRNPAISWSGIPDGARSLVLVCVDRSVPSRPDDVNKAGREVPADLPRVNFHHWVMVDIPVACEGIAEGACSDGVTARGKRNPPGPAGSRQGLNDYTGWFAGDDAMAGEYYGYDGPCPPWNDSIVHHYHFILLATDLARCPVEGAFGGDDVMRALEGRVLARTEIVGLYAINPSVRR